jgi:hypothetical protein
LSSGNDVRLGVRREQVEGHAPARVRRLARACEQRAGRPRLLSRLPVPFFRSAFPSRVSSRGSWSEITSRCRELEAVVLED